MTNESDPKIIVDDNWKEQVQREKEQLEQQPAEAQAQSQAHQLPEASFGFIVTSFATQALSALGYVPNPVTGKSEPDRDLAKHLIDSLGVLEEKTVGNLSEDEGGLLKETLHQLRMAYVSGGSAESPGNNPGDDGGAKSSTIELP